jgi:hypothetical protein
MDAAETANTLQRWAGGLAEDSPVRYQELTLHYEEIIEMDPSTINWLAVVSATLAAFLLGGLWYSPPLFGRQWMRENGFTDDDLAQRNMAKVFGLSFLWTLIMAVNLAFFLNAPGTTVAWGAIAGFLAGFGWIAMGIFVIGLFEKRPARLLLINGGYMVIALVLMGAILGAWR